MPERRKRRTYNPRLVRRDCTYSIEQLANLFSVHANTIHLWRRDGLRAIDGLRPILFHGSDIQAFLNNRQGRRKVKCAPTEFYCCRCRRPRVPWERLVDIEIRNSKQLLLKAVCPVCGAGMNKAGSTAKIGEYRKIFDIQTVAGEGLAV
ncbi:MAG: DNA-binding protein [Hyphomicrobiales bacterium]|nr:MAG: DNA-binding protein [Hyphomicrobiales bacterium]